MFVKNSAKTQVKSRLAAALDSQTALSLYRCFVADLLETIGRAEWPLIIFFYPPDAGKEMKAWLGKGCVLAPQRGSDLGERMQNAFEEVFFHGFKSALLIGSDIPDLPSRILNEASDSLRTNDAVIGPAFDGGYYLIGFNSDTFAPEVFEDVAWSTSETFKQTMSTFGRLGLRVHELPSWRDVDTYDDLEALSSRNAATSFAGSATMEYLKNLKGGAL
jgi:uncharacterized protein